MKRATLPTDLTDHEWQWSVYNLAYYHLLPEHFALIGFARNDMSDESFRLP